MKKLLLKVLKVAHVLAWFPFGWLERDFPLRYLRKKNT
jgi:hypothetical protein